MAGYSLTTLDAIPDVPTATDPGDPAWKPIQHHLGLTAFGINAYTARAAGDELAAEPAQPSSAAASRAMPSRVHPHAEARVTAPRPGHSPRHRVGVPPTRAPAGRV